MVSRRCAHGLLRPKRCGTAPAQSSSSTELLRLFRASGGSAPKTVAQRDGVQSSTDGCERLSGVFQARPRTVVILLILNRRTIVLDCRRDRRSLVKRTIHKRGPLTR